MMRVAVALAAVAVLGFVWFPGHTWLHQDTQIYVPMLQKLENPALFERELLTSRPHLAFTVYDETAYILRRITGAPYEYVLGSVQLISRLLGLCGAFLAATAMGLDRRLAMAAAALFGLGATVAGPAVLTFEYEPVPRGFAVALVYLAIGLTMRHRLFEAGIAASVAFLFHPPTTVPFWLVFAWVCLRAGRPALRAWIPLTCAAAALLVLSQFQPGLSERQVFFGRIDPDLEKLQRLRAAYNWVDLWPPGSYWHYLTLACVTVAAVWRMRLRGTARRVLLGLTALGLLSVPFSFLVLDVLRWALMPQVQPARAVLFVVVAALLSSSAAGMRAAVAGRWPECAAWLVVPVLLPMHRLLFDPYKPRELGVLLICVAALTAAATLAGRKPGTWPALAVAVAGVYLAIPGLAGVRNYPRLWTPELVELSRWAANSTPEDALFHFAGLRRDLYPGIFRSEARRAVYVDWKAGGQVNYFKTLADEWWKRWSETALNSPPPEDLKRRGIDYVVTKSSAPFPGGTQVFSNAEFTAYRL